MARIIVDGREYEAEEGANLLQVLLSLGLDLPYFCWHPAMGAVGACRQCAVQQFRDEGDTRGRVVMACMVAVKEGLRLSLAHPTAEALRKGVIEWLMTNHPHDCPVCDEGGECHLQDMTLMTGHTRRRYRFEKRTFRNQDLGPFLNHEMNRCITCYRCVRFYRDYAGGRDLHAFASKNEVWFGRHEDGPLENEFSGNLAEVCPTGVFTDKTLGRHYVRKWDQQYAPSLCVHCGHGCNISAGERYGMLRRVVNRFNQAVNGYFICDRGRFGYEFVNGPLRLRLPVVTGRRGREEVSAEAAVAEIGAIVAAHHGRLLGIGSPRASLESNFALRELVGAENFYAGISGRQLGMAQTAIDILRDGPTPTPTLAEVETSDAVLVLGEDLPNTDPRLALAVRQASRHASWRLADRLGIPRWQDASVRDAAEMEPTTLFVAAPVATRLDDVACRTLRLAPADLVHLANAVAARLDPAIPAAPPPPQGCEEFTDSLATLLASAERPLIVTGVSCGSEPILQAAANLAWALTHRQRGARLAIVLPEANTLGLALMADHSLDDALARAEAGAANALIVLENDLYRRLPRALLEPFLERMVEIIALDHQATETTRRAQHLLPSATFAESDGTLVSSEGRGQRLFQAISPQPELMAGWRWLDRVGAAALKRPLRWPSLDDVIGDCAGSIAALAPIAAAAPAATFRIGGRRVARQPHRFSGRTAIHADRTVHEPPPPGDRDAPLNFSMEGYTAPVPAPLTPFFWAPGWNSWQAVNKFQQEVGGALRGGDAGVRLLNPSPGRRRYFDLARSTEGAPAGRWRLVPLHRIFGSDELSSEAPAVASRIMPPRLALNPEDAASRGFIEGQEITFDVDHNRFRLPVVLRPDLPRGVAGLDASLPGVAFFDQPGWIEIPRLEPVEGEG